MKRAADTLTPVSLELGGKDPLIVTARRRHRARGQRDRLRRRCSTPGQICMSIERVYVEEPIYDEFVGKLTEQVETLRQGADGRSYTAEIGAMTTPAQIDIVADHVEDAREKGARVLTGGKRKDGPGDWYEPTVIADVDHSMKVMTDETFGPVIPVMKVSDADEAVRAGERHAATGSRRRSSPATRARASAIARRIEAGAVNVNDVLTTYFAMGVPMGGWKDSGHRLPPLLVRDQEVRPPGVPRDPARQAGQARPAVVPLHVGAPQVRSTASTAS